MIDHDSMCFPYFAFYSNLTFVVIVNMEEHYMGTSYESDIDRLLFDCKHSIVHCQAELNVLKSHIQQTNEECDSIAAELHKLDASLQSSHGNSSNAPSQLKDELVSKLFRKMSFLQFYRESETKAHKQLAESTEQHSILMAQKVHFDLHHKQ